MWSNFHTHNRYCDGKGPIKDYLNEALRAGMKYIGFSSHAHIPFPCQWCMKRDALPDYLQEIESLKPGFPTLEIYKGLEIDFIPGIIGPADYSSGLDYTIGSIHFVDSFEGHHWEIDSTAEVFREGLAAIFENNIRKAITRYYELTREMLSKSPPDVLGHLDKIKINSQDVFFEDSESWYRHEIEKTLKSIRQRNTVVEVNTRGLYRKLSASTYPSPWILERIYELQIPITLSSDAHHPEDLTQEFGPTVAMLRNIGYRYLSVLNQGIWKEMPLDEYGTDR